MAIQPPWYPRAGQVPQAGLTPQQFQDLQALFLGLGNPACPVLRVCGTPVNGYYPVWNGTTNQANWAASPSALVGLVDGPGTYAGAANYFVKIDSLGTGFVFSPLVLSFLALSDAPTPATYVGNALKGIRVNAAENRLEFYTTGAGTGDFVGPAVAIDGSIVLFDTTTGKLGKQGPELSLGGNDVADAGKVPLFGTEGQLFGSAVSSGQAAITGSTTAGGTGGRFTSSGGKGVDISVFGLGGWGINVATQNGQAAQFLLTGTSTDAQLYVRRIAGLASAGLLAEFIGNTNLALHIDNDGGITWTGTTGRDTTRTSLGLGTAAYLAAATTSTANAVVQALGTGKIDTSFLPDSVVGAMKYQGVWNGTTNTPAIPASSAANVGWFYIVSVGVAAGHGYANIPNIAYDVGDWIASSGVGWDKIDNTDAVVSFNSRIGAILPAAGDYTAALITNTPAGGIAATDVQAALNELDTDKEPTITAGTTAQYWRGDKSWQDLFASVRAATLTGLSVASAAVVTAADTVLAAIGQLQAQITANVAAIALKMDITASIGITYTGGSVANNTTTLADVHSSAGWTSLPPGVWMLCLNIIYDAAATGTGAHFTLNGTATITAISGQVTYTTGTGDRSDSNIVNYDTGLPVPSSALTTNNNAVLNALIWISGTGDVLLRFRSEVGASAITVTNVNGFATKIG